MKGSCLCGAVSITAGAHTEINACHCSMCQRWGGGPLLSVHCGSDLQITGQDAVATFKSSEWAERGFCARCGTHLYYRLVQVGNEKVSEYAVPVGLFQDGTSFSFDEQIFIDKKPAYYAFANRTRMLTEAEVFAKFGAS